MLIYRVYYVITVYYTKDRVLIYIYIYILAYYYPISSYIAYIIVDDESFLETAMMANATMHHSGHINKLVYNSSEQTTTN